MKNKLLLLAIGIAFTTQMITAQVPTYVPTNGLAGWWSFSGNANDYSTNANNGIVNGAELTIDRFGNSNSAYNFNGKSSYIQVAHNSTFDFETPNSITISTWFKTSMTTGALFVQKQSGVGATQNGVNCGILDSNGHLAGIIKKTPGNQSIVSNIATSFNNNSWHHFVYTFSSGVAKLYMDGLLISTQTNLGNIIANSNTNLIFGYGLPLNNFYYNGLLDDIGIWNRALTQNEITNLFDAKLVCEKSYATVGYLKASYNPTYEPIIDKSSWHYIAVTKNGLDGNIYLDGKLITNSTYYNQPFIWNSLLLGASQTCVSCSPTPDYIGLIDELRVSNVVRTANEIQNHFNSNVPLSEDNNTLGLFHFDNALGNVMTNSATSKNGILYGGVNYVQGKFGQGLSFDGIDDYARFSQTIPVDNMTIEYWFKSTDDSGTMAMLEYAYNTGIYIQTISGDCQSLSIDGKDDKEVIIKNDIKIYPNPTNNKITIDCGIFANVTGYKIKIFNLLGQEVFGDAMNQQQYIVPLNTWGGQGVYLVKIYDASNNLLDTKKIILQ